MAEKESKKSATNSIAVGGIMTRSVETFKINASLYKAIEKMGRKGISCVLITDDGRPVGVLTERDVIRKVILKNLDPHSSSVNDVMSTPVLSIGPDTDIINAGNIMRKNKIRRLAIVDNEKLIGLITETDVLTATTRYIKHLNWRLVEGEITLKEYERIMKDVRMLVEI
ncbi:hypothetical protein COV93_07585 [Candidatus Woesearchaeota archaeon CG11_big_fil_rev_8_21_14_0_20_43_8]|nr:MAG: hypothetical protein COV93_07585 [Candidatus Woesearchaeota archaeon CG11_big_fil_rev_8_21_14_0_20_43_8]